MIGSRQLHSVPKWRVRAIFTDFSVLVLHRVGVSLKMPGVLYPWLDPLCVVERLPPFPRRFPRSLVFLLARCTPGSASAADLVTCHVEADPSLPMAAAGGMIIGAQLLKQLLCQAARIARPKWRVRAILGGIPG